MSEKIILNEKVNNNSNYIISIKDNRGIITFNGFLPYEGINKFLEGYNQLKNLLNPSISDLVLNAENLNTFPKELENDLGNLYCDYVNTFKRVFIVTPSNIITKMQAQRVLKSNNIFEKVTFVDSISDIE